MVLGTAGIAALDSVVRALLIVLRAVLLAVLLVLAAAVAVAAECFSDFDIAVKSLVDIQSNLMRAGNAKDLGQGWRLQLEQLGAQLVVIDAFDDAEDVQVIYT